FLLSDVAADIAEKLVRRHPHVFGDVKANNADAAIESWESVKRKENGGKPKPAVSIPRALPALARAQKIARRDKARKQADVRDIAARVNKLPRARNREKALGEVLFALAAYAADKHIDAESALRAAAKSAARV
ncbi:MAG TPA: nucleoside triphosphate pyrophosphohydrolase, partial [Anaerolineae bacterium]